MSTVFCIFDGFGLLPTSPNNCNGLAKMPNFQALLKNNHWTTLNADGTAVGQESGLVGNSEVGHMNLGGLQLVSQLSYQITQSSLKNFELNENIAVDQIFNPADKIKGQKTIHLIGLFSTGTIHSDLRHWLGAINSANSAGVKKIVLHLMTDGRDSDRASFVETLKSFEKMIDAKVKSKVIIGSFGGRAYAMDRDNNFEKVFYGLQAMYGKNLLTTTKDLQAKYKITEFQTAQFQPKSFDIIESIEVISNLVKAEYKKDIYDEFLTPTSFEPIKEGETMWLVNFRSDRMKQIVSMLSDYNHDQKHTILAMNDYGVSGENYEFIFKSEPIEDGFSFYASQLGKTQLHTAETEKYNHVTYFFNGGQNVKNNGEVWTVIPSNKLLNHSEKPEMKAKEVTDVVIDGLGSYDYIVVNYANPDMVGHCGDIKAGIKSMEFLDEQLGRLLKAIDTGNHKMVITADHGNIEFVGPFEKDGKKLTDTEHNPSPVPLIIVAKDFDSNKLIDRVYQFTKNNQIPFDLKNLSKSLTQNNSIEGKWPTKKEIPYPLLPLWYAGLIAFCI
jgi:2,3-bisphosphoglycerate-independent phosphoglycerate mutase